jgi:hypothetical protein
MDNINNQLLSDLNGCLIPPDAGQNNKSDMVQFNFRVTQVCTKPHSTVAGQASVSWAKWCSSSTNAAVQPSTCKQGRHVRHVITAVAAQQL